MNELKDIYGIELSDIEVLKSALKILSEESDRVQSGKRIVLNYKHQSITRILVSNDKTTNDLQ